MCSLLALGEWVGPGRDSLIWITELQLLQAYSQSFHLFSLPFLQSLLLCLVEYVCAYMVMSLKFSRVRFSLGERWRREGKGVVLCSSRAAALHRGLLSIAVLLLGKNQMVKCTDRFRKINLISNMLSCVLFVCWACK